MSRNGAGGGGVALARDWNDEKTASVDWANPEDVLANNFTFLQIVLLNPKLDKHLTAHAEERAAAKETFRAVATVDDEEVARLQSELLRKWNNMKLLTLRSARWCRRCGLEGHTRRTCPELVGRGDDEEVAVGVAGVPDTESQLSPTSTIMGKLIAHQQRIERIKLLAEKKKRSSDGAGHGGQGGGNRRGGGGGGGAGGGGGGLPAQSSAATEAETFAEERRCGTIVRLDQQFNIGFIRVAELGEVKFFLNNADYGVKTITEGDSVIFKLDTSRNYPLAVDVRPEKNTVTLDDAARFLERCSTTAQPIDMITTLLTHPHEWYEVLRHIGASRGAGGAAPAASPTAATTITFAEAVHTLVELTTFIGNREPIHLNMLRKFLRMTATKASDVLPPRAVAAAQNAANVPLYPDLLHAALAEGRQRIDALASVDTSEARKRLSYLVDQWIEVGNYVVLLSQFTSVPHSTLQPTVNHLIPVFERHLENPATRPSQSQQLAAVVQRLRRAVSGGSSGGGAKGTSLIPTAAEFSVPPTMPDSVFAPKNLPVNGRDRYTATEDFIAAQCKLLRADTFEATARVMPAICYELESYTPTSETQSDIQHARVFGKVRFMGRVVTRDRDFSNPISYILHVEPHSQRADLRSQLHPGTTVFISTGLDKTTISDDEVFWGIISSCDSHLLSSGAVVVAPCEDSASFDKLEEKLRRNEEAGRPEMSMLLETPIFMAGYAGIVRALQAFIGPLAMPLPVSDIIVGPQVADARHSGGAKGNSELLNYIPPHCEQAFRELTKEVRSSFALDAGQDAVMRDLPTSKLLLVQGPPGTGKSFIGCRVVETYVKYKQLVASGDIFQKISVDTLHDTGNGAGGVDKLLPQVGPVVVITYKNHALDEFLVDLLDSGLWDGARPRVGQQLAGSTVSGHDMFPRGKRLIRIGGRSKETRLDGHNLGSIMHGINTSPTIKSLRERVYVMYQRLTKLVEQVHHLEHGRVPRSYFDRWLTPDQRRTISFVDKDAWLRGERYVGTSAQSNDDPQLYLKMLRTKMAAALTKAAAEKTASPTPGASPTAASPAPGPVEEEEEVSLSVFQEMKREDERRDVNDVLHKTYLSAEAIWLAAHPPTVPSSVPEGLLSLWSLDPVARHEYYTYLIQQSISVKAKNCLLIMETLANVIDIRNHAVDEARLALLRGADVIGLTTTGCAMNQNLLRSLRPSVLVVEEAAEVLESQLLACMTDSLEQVVLIGDHFQLQPKVDTFAYEKTNRLNLSLFERLSRRVTPIRLTEQRRMHPYISRLVRPFYGEDQPLIDHPLVQTRPFITSSGHRVYGGVPGLAKRVFFWRHTYPEEEAPGSRSKVNMRETLMTKQIVLHLVAEGVPQSSITVITPYLGQCRMLRSVMRMSSMTEVRVSTVDLFQGDENDIIILSMTRTEKLTEFIRMRNRLIVSCSRARYAMVLVGNDALLRQCSHWDLVLGMLDEEGCVGDTLPITYRDKPGEVAHMEVKGTLSASRVVQAIDAVGKDKGQPAAGAENEEAPAA